MKVLLDADALVAIAKEDDTNHVKALKIIDAHKELTLFTSPFTIREAATVLSHRVSHDAAKKFLAETRSSSFNELPLDPGVIEAADFLFLEQTGRGVSWPDCLNVALFKAHHLQAIFSFDQFYVRCGIRVLFE